MIDIGFRITQTGQYILIISGGILILAGVIIAIISIIRSRKSKKTKVNQDELFDIIQNKPQEEIQTKIKENPRRRRSNKY